MAAFASTFALVFLTELGDKSMLLALTFGSRYRAWLVIVAVTLSAGIVMALAVLAGGAVEALVPRSWIATTAGLLFIGFGLWAWFRGADGDAADGQLEQRRASLIVLALVGAFVLSEFGDKTQLAVLSISGLSPASRVGVWAGGTLGFIVVDSAAVLLGDRLRRLVSSTVIARVSAIAFVIFGVVALALAVAA